MVLASAIYNKFVFHPQLLEHRRVASLEIDDIWVGRERLENHRGYFLWNARVASDTHMCESAREPIVRHISLEECILRVELDSVIDVRSTKDASLRIVSHNLIANSIVCHPYVGC